MCVQIFYIPWLIFSRKITRSHIICKTMLHLIQNVMQSQRMKNAERNRYNFKFRVPQLLTPLMCTILTNAETNNETWAKVYATENFIFTQCSLILTFWNNYPFTLLYYLTVQSVPNTCHSTHYFFCRFVRRVLSAHGWTVRGSNLGRGKRFFSSPKPSRSAQRPPHPPVHWIPGFVPGRDDDHPP